MRVMAHRSYLRGPITLLASHGGHATVDDELGPGHESSFVRCQIDSERSNLVRLGVAPKWHAGAQLLAQCLRIAPARTGRDVLQHPGLYKARVDRVTTNAIALTRTVQRDRLGEQANRPFCGVVGHEVVAAHDPGHGRHVEDYAAAVFHDPHAVPAAQERAIHVDALHAPPRLERDRLDRGYRNDPRVVDQDVEPAMLRGNAIHDPLPRPIVGHVELPEGEAWRFNAGALTGCGIDVGDDNVGAFTREAMSDGQSDPTS